MKTQSAQQAFDLFEAHRREFLENCRWVAKKIAKSRGNVTIDDVRAECPVPLNLDGRVYGAVFQSDDFVLQGYTKTKVKTSHGRIIGIYTLNPEYKFTSVSPKETQLAFL